MDKPLPAIITSHPMRRERSASIDAEVEFYRTLVRRPQQTSQPTLDDNRPLFDEQAFSRGADTFLLKLAVRMEAEAESKALALTPSTHPSSTSSSGYQSSASSSSSNSVSSLFSSLSTCATSASSLCDMTMPREKVESAITFETLGEEPAVLYDPEWCQYKLPFFPRVFGKNGHIASSLSRVARRLRHKKASPFPETDDDLVDDGSYVYVPPSFESFIEKHELGDLADELNFGRRNPELIRHLGEFMNWSARIHPNRLYSGIPDANVKGSGITEAEIRRIS